VVSRRVRRRRRQFAVAGAAVVVVLIALVVLLNRSGPSPKATAPPRPAVAVSFPKRSPLNPDWKGDGQAVTLGFGGDVHFAGAVGNSLTQNPSTALGTTIPQLFAGTQLRMVNLETAITNNTCPESQPKQYIFDAPPSAITALKSATISLVTEANDHGVDCGQRGLAENLSIASQAAYPIIGIGNDAAQAFTPYRVTINGQRIAIISATQNIQDNLVTAWTATATQPGVASAIDPTQLVRKVQQVRPTADTVIVYLHWGTETQACPNPQQEPLAKQLVRAGADIVLGTDAHVLSGGGYLGGAYVDYGLGNFAFYDDTPPETSSGSLILTAVGRHVTGATFRPATIVAGLPQPLAGAPATAAVRSWNAARSCTNLAAKPSASLATMSGETTPFVAPPTTTATSTTTTAPPAPGSGATTSTTSRTTTTTTRSSAPGSKRTTTTSAAPRTTTTAPRSTTSPSPSTTSPTDNAG
jgi:poly-gamma-glutamate synthesis protein (capsule biosynthesis protein)